MDGTSFDRFTRLFGSLSVRDSRRAVLGGLAALFVGGTTTAVLTDDADARRKKGKRRRKRKKKSNGNGRRDYEVAACPGGQNECSGGGTCPAGYTCQARGPYAASCCVYTPAACPAGQTDCSDGGNCPEGFRCQANGPYAQSCCVPETPPETCGDRCHDDHDCGDGCTCWKTDYEERGYCSREPICSTYGGQCGNSRNNCCENDGNHYTCSTDYQCCLPVDQWDNCRKDVCCVDGDRKQGICDNSYGYWDCKFPGY